MDTTMKTTQDCLKDLILLNNDRYEGYQKASGQTNESDLKELFTRLSVESKKFAGELQSHFPGMDDVPKEDETTNSGKLYRVWMDVKNALSTNDRHSVLAACEYGEDVIKKGYEDALQERDTINADVLTVIQRQYDSLLEAHNHVKALRDGAKK